MTPPESKKPPAPSLSNDMGVFCRDAVKRNRLRSLDTFMDYNFLFDWVRKDLTSRLCEVNRTFDACLQIGGRSPVLKSESGGKIMHLSVMDIDEVVHSFNQKRDYDAFVVGDEEFLPFGEETLDLCLSNLCLHSVNDLPGALLQIRKALKPDGLFLSAMLGGETLHELRACLTDAEIEIKGGLSPRIFPFADKQQAGALLQRAGFALPVIDSEIVTVTYPHIFKLMHDLRGMGEGNAIKARANSFTERTLFMRAGELYQERYSEPDSRIAASFEIIFMIGWSPHDSQQKPLRPGSAETRLADALGSDEIKAGDKAKP